MWRLLITITFFLFSEKLSISQCCGQATPLGGVGNLGVLNKGSLQVVLFHKYSSSVNQTENNPYLILDANYNFVGTTISYGLSKKLTLETELGYFINKTQHYKLNPVYTLKGFGLSNGVLSVKASLLATKHSNWEIVGGLGLKFPFSTNYQMVDGVQLPIDNQTSTCAFGVVPKILIFKKYPKKNTTILLLHRPDLNFKNKNGYTYGSGFTTGLFFSKQLSFISKNTMGILQIRNDVRLRDINTDGSLSQTTGSNVVFVSPQIGQTILKNYFLSFAFDIPIYQNFNTEKLKYKYAFSFSFVANLPNCKVSKEVYNDSLFSESSTGIKDSSFYVYGNCTMCKSAIESTLLKMKGIESASWNVETKILSVKYDDQKISVDEIKQKLAKIGYDTDAYRASDKAYDGLHGCCKYERAVN